MDTEDALVLESALSVYDDASGEREIGFDPNGAPEVADIVAFVWEYVEYTYPETDTLYNVMDDALEDLSTDESSRRPPNRSTRDGVIVSLTLVGYAPRR